MNNHHFDAKKFWFAIRYIIIPALVLLAVAELTHFSLRLPIERTYLSEFSVPVTEVIPVSEKKIAEQKTLRLGFVGDIMMNRSVEASVVKNGKGDFKFIFEHIAPFLSSFDFLFGNLEGTISDKGSNRGSLYSFHMDPKSMEALTFAGFDAVSLANNHMGDWGVEALIDTMDRLNDARILYVGGGKDKEEAYSPKFITVNGVTLGLVAFSEFSEFFKADEGPGIAIIEQSEVVRRVEQANEDADIVIISFHYGTEYAKVPNQFQKTIAEASIDAGADLVIGHHPHVTQPTVPYKQGYIAYSLGNFVFDQYFSSETMRGNLLEVVIEEGAITKVIDHPIVMNSWYQPRLEEAE